MKIKELIFENFKSYAVKTNLKDFDSQFNALSSEKESGESDILQAIFIMLSFYI